MIEEYYMLCEILGDDLEMVAKIIQHHQTKKEKLQKIQNNLEDLKITKYKDDIKMILDKPIQYIRAFEVISKGLC